MWNWKNADRKKYTENTDNILQQHITSNHNSIKVMEEIFRKAVIKSVITNIGKKKVGQHIPRSVNEEIKQSMEERDRARETHGI